MYRPSAARSSSRAGVDTSRVDSTAETLRPASERTPAAGAAPWRPRCRRRTPPAPPDGGRRRTLDTRPGGTSHPRSSRPPGWTGAAPRDQRGTCREPVVVVNLYSHSECMQHVSRNHVKTGKQPKNIKSNKREKNKNKIIIIMIMKKRIIG